MKHLMLSHFDVSLLYIYFFTLISFHVSKSFIRYIAAECWLYSFKCLNLNFSKRTVSFQNQLAWNIFGSRFIVIHFLDKCDSTGYLLSNLSLSFFLHQRIERYNFIFQFYLYLENKDICIFISWILFIFWTTCIYIYIYRKKFWYKMIKEHRNGLLKMWVLFVFISLF